MIVANRRPPDLTSPGSLLVDAAQIVHRMPLTNMNMSSSLANLQGETGRLSKVNR